MKWFTTLLVLLLAVPAWAEIEMPDQSDVGAKLTATVKATVPEGATFDGGWKVSCQGLPVCTAQWGEMKEPNTIGLWMKDAGTYEVSYSGFWLLTKEVTFKDGAGNDVTITSYLGHGFVNESKSVVVGAPVPPPPPPASRAVIVEESEQRTAAQAALWGQVRKAYQQKLPIVDESSPGTYSAIVQAAHAKSSPLPLPALVLLDTAGGVVAVEKCPDTLQGLRQRIGG